jgi:hypothetical protein
MMQIGEEENKVVVPHADIELRLPKGSCTKGDDGDYFAAVR